MIARYAPRMKRSNVNTGSRDEILAELEEYGRDRARQGNRDKAAAFAQAHNVIEAGADVVRVGSSVWHVNGDASPSDWEIAAAASDTATATAG